MELGYKGNKTKTKTELEKDFSWSWFDGCSRNHFCCSGTDHKFRCIPDPTGSSSMHLACKGKLNSDDRDINWIGEREDSGGTTNPYTGNICMQCDAMANGTFDITAYDGTGIDGKQTAHVDCMASRPRTPLPTSPILPDTCENKITNELLTIRTDGKLVCAHGRPIACHFHNDFAGKRIWNCNTHTDNVLIPTWGYDIIGLDSISGQTCDKTCKEYGINAICAMNCDKVDSSKCHCIPEGSTLPIIVPDRGSTCPMAMVHAPWP